MIAVVDYGMGNLRSVHKALEKVGFEVETTSDPEKVVRAQKVVLPGVGAFADAIRNLRNTGMSDAILEVIRLGKPFLGICLGLQLLFSESEEDGIHRGLDIIPGRVRRLPPIEKVPHMGWNQVSYSQETALFDGIPNNSYFYFVHSYYVDPDDPGVAAATTQHGITFTCAIKSGTIFATQFHPEKSSALGLKLLRNFGEWKP